MTQVLIQTVLVVRGLVRKVKTKRLCNFNLFLSEAGPCGTNCKYPSLMLVTCINCKRSHHHLCDGDTGDTSICAKCAGH